MNRIFKCRFCPYASRGQLAGSPMWAQKHVEYAHLVLGGTMAAVPPPFRLSDPALCGSCPLVTPY